MFGSLGLQFRNSAARAANRAFAHFSGKRLVGLRSDPPTTAASRLIALLGDGRLDAYLEIGIYKGFTFESVSSLSVEGVDPNPLCVSLGPRRIYPVTSDEFFCEFPTRPSELPRLYDAIFIDGLHEADQVLRDVRNAINVLRRTGFILIDDPLPVDEWASRRWNELSLVDQRKVKESTRSWQGDVFRAVDFLLHSNISSRVFLTRFETIPFAIVLGGDPIHELRSQHAHESTMVTYENALKVWQQKEVKVEHVLAAIHSR